MSKVLYIYHLFELKTNLKNGLKNNFSKVQVNKMPAFTKKGYKKMKIPKKLYSLIMEKRTPDGGKIEKCPSYHMINCHKLSANGTVGKLENIKN